MNPKGLVFDKKSGNVIIADSGNHRIQVAKIRNKPIGTQKVQMSHQ